MVDFRLKILIGLFVISACYEQDISLDGLDREEVLVIYGVLSPNRSPTFRLFKTFKASSSSSNYSELLIEGAKGILFEDGDAIDEIVPQSAGNYGLKHLSMVHPGRSYVVKISAPGLDSIISEAVLIPNKAPNFSLALDTTDCIQLINGFRGCKLSLTLLDSLGSDLLLDFQGKPSLGARSFPKLIGYNGGSSLCQETGYDNLRIVPGSCIAISELAYYLPIEMESSRELRRFDEYLITLGSVSQSYVKYITNYIQQLDYAFTLLFEPEVTYTNIKGGLGFIGAVNDTTISLTW